VHDWLTLAGLLLPLVAAGLGSLILSQGYARRAERYAESAAVLRDLEPKLNAVRTWDGLARVADQVEDALLQELLEWHVFTRFTGHAH
jgi:hypothetical protein